MIQELKVCSNKINAEGVKNLMQTNFKCLKKLDLCNIFLNKLIIRLKIKVSSSYVKNSGQTCNILI